MKIDNLDASVRLKDEIKKVIYSRSKKTVMFGYFNYEMEKKTLLQRIEARAARDRKALELERFMIRKGRVVLLGADRQSFTDKEFRILDKSLCFFQNGRVKKKSQIARAMLSKIVNGRKINWHADELNAGAFNYAPFLYKRGEYDKAVMIDLSRAHYSIYSKLSFDLRLLFDKDRFIGFRNGKIKMNAIKRETDKTILQRIYGVFASQSFKVWDGVESEKVLDFDKKKGYENELYSPTLVFAVMQTLHNIAAMAYQCGAVYIYTDGYMFEKGKENRFVDWLDKCGFSFKIEGIGKAAVFGYNNYSIGNKRVGTNPHISKAQIDASRERRRSDAFRDVIKEVFDDVVNYHNNNIDFSAVNFVTGKDLLNRQFNLDLR